VVPVPAAPAEPVPIAFDRYHDTAQTNAICRQLAALRPDLCSVEVIGKSTGGREIVCVTITNTKTGKPEDKPAMYVDGNHHGNERSGGEAALYVACLLVRSYDQDVQVRKLVDTRTFYVVPKVNPDGAEVWIRGFPEGVDEDGDEKEDEDGFEDLDGDGLITWIREQDPTGDYMIGPDPRLMIRIPQGAKADPKKRYRVYTEGIDNDDDGQFNEDQPSWKTDPNRDYPVDEELRTKFRKKFVGSGPPGRGGGGGGGAGGGGGRGGGGGGWGGRGQDPPEDESPGHESLTHPETKAVADFLKAHPNIAMAQSFHNYGAILFRPFGYAPDEYMPKEDRALYDRMAKEFTRCVGSKAYDRPYGARGYVVGGLHDYLYVNLGVPALTAEIFCIPGWEQDFGSRDRRPQKAEKRKEKKGPRKSADVNYNRQKQILDFMDQEAGGSGYVAWHELDHPQLGKVEVGGLWNEYHATYNPPPGLLEKTIEGYARFALAQAELTPLARITDTRLERASGGAVTIQATVENLGPVPSVCELAEKRGLAKPVTLALQLPAGCKVVIGKDRLDFGVLPPGFKRTIRWTVKPPQPGAYVFELKLDSEKAGREVKKIEVGPEAF
jgi:uncharacterized membrane protein YgcG